MVDADDADRVQVGGADLLDGLEVVVAVVEEGGRVVRQLQEHQPLLHDVRQRVRRRVRRRRLGAGRRRRRRLRQRHVLERCRHCTLSLYFIAPPDLAPSSLSTFIYILHSTLCSLVVV